MNELLKYISAHSPEKRRILLQRFLERQNSNLQAQNSACRNDLHYWALSFAQQRLWFLEQLQPGSPRYNIPVLLRLEGTLNIAALKCSIREIIRRHEILRTTFKVVDNYPMQVITSDMQHFPVSFINLESLTVDERLAEVQRLMDREGQFLFDLTQGPLVRAILVRLNTVEHLLLLTLHHIVSDGWSLKIFLNELATLYTAYSKGRPSPLPELPLQYVDYALCQRVWLQGGTLERLLTYWINQLASAPMVLELPTNRARPTIPNFQGAYHSFTLAHPLVRALKSLSQQEGVSLFMALLAAFQALLSRYIGQSDFMVGVPIAGRTHTELEGLIGFFVNTLALRADLSDNPTVRELLRRVRKVCLEAYEHQDLPFERLVEELRPDRSLSHTPLIQVMFLFQDAPGMTVELPGLCLTLQEYSNSTAKFDLVFEIVEGIEGDLKGNIEYSADLFEAEMIGRMADHFQMLLQGIVADPEQHVSKLPILTDKERHQLLVEWNNTRTESTSEYTVHRLFETQVERTPDAVAVGFEEEFLTYRELNGRANQLAHHLRHNGVGPETLVGICVERSLDMVVGLLGILKAGGAYVPLDPAFPPERLAFMLEDAGVSVLVTQQRPLKALPAHKAKVVCLDSDAARIAQQSESGSLPQTTSDHLAYVIYTSGSTGQPKGVQILHRAVVNFLLSMREQPGLSPQDTFLAITTLSFDIAVLELFLPLIVGARVLVASREATGDGVVLAEILDRAGVTTMQATPVTWRLLLAAGWRGKTDLKVLCGGEALSLDLAKQLLQRTASLWNLYGPTETTIWSTLGKIEPGDEVVTIGRPIANTQVYLLDAHLQPTPIGVPGELFIGGDGLARGYLNRPELTAERFLPHPFGDHPNARMYRTGDLARYRPDGSIEHLGRLDFQVKLHGFRIELGEIETVLSEHPTVQQSVVIVREDMQREKYLVAYVVIAQPQICSISDLREYVRERLPNYMIPSAFVILESFPLTPNGKVDRNRLPVPDHFRPQLRKAYVPPEDMLELRLVRIWEEVLGISPIGTDDNFFELGGHSLQAAQLIGQLHQNFGKEIPLVTLLRGGTIKHCAAALRMGNEAVSWSRVVTIQEGTLWPPLFVIHPLYGKILSYIRLAYHLGKDQPVYGLQSQGIDGMSEPLVKLEHMAATYIEAIRKIQPVGPYLFAGYSFGGSVAFEMARQFHNQGEKVALLALLDTINVYQGLLEQMDDISYWERYWSFRFEDLPPLNLDQLRLLDSEERFDYVLEQLNLADKLPDGFTLENGYQSLKIEKGNIQALYEYIPTPYPGKITLFRTSESLTNSLRDPLLGWGKLVGGGIDIYEIKCDHAALLKSPNVELIAQIIKDCISNSLKD